MKSGCESASSAAGDRSTDCMVLVGYPLQVAERDYALSLMEIRKGVKDEASKMQP